jgi:hypothetical protein
MSQWIKLDPDNKTTWPKADEEILLYIRKEICRGRMDVYDFGISKRMVFSCATHYQADPVYGLPMNEVSHWMPLPEPPED